MTFDLVQVRGKDVRSEPLGARLDRLQGLLQRPVPGVTVCEASPDGEVQLQAYDVLGKEAGVSTRKSSRYVAGRRSTWRKVKAMAWRTKHAGRWKAFAWARPFHR